MDFANFREGCRVLSAVALYGAILSTFNYVQAARKDRRDVFVQATTAIPTYGNTLGNCLAKVEAINAGHRAVTVSNLAFELPGGKRLFPMGSGVLGMDDTRMPAGLSDGEAAHSYVSYGDIEDALLGHGRIEKARLTPICTDSLGTVHRGKPWEIDPCEFARM
jgi:hypothetical protein